MILRTGLFCLIGFDQYGNLPQNQLHDARLFRLYRLLKKYRWGVAQHSGPLSLTALSFAVLSWF